MVSVAIHSLSWPNADRQLAEGQASVFKHFGLPIKQHIARVDHGEWIDFVLKEAKEDTVIVVDNDCVPLNKKAVDEAIDWVTRNESFLGMAQASSHIDSGKHVFAAPAFLAVNLKAWRKLGMPSSKSNSRSDVAEEVSWQAEEQGLKYKAWYPTYYHHASEIEGLWKLSNYGHYGIGTVFADRVFHLYQGRCALNVKLYTEVCEQIVNNTFSTENYQSCIA